MSSCEQTHHSILSLRIMDALDPNDNIEFASDLYNSSTFELSLMNALSEDGILVAQIGMRHCHMPLLDMFN